jgi:hypothetical protein
MAKATTYPRSTYTTLQGVTVYPPALAKGIRPAPNCVASVGPRKLRPAMASPLAAN